MIVFHEDAFQYNGRKWTWLPRQIKSGDENNYRPISMIPVVAKVFDSVVHCQLYEYLEVKEALNTNLPGTHA